MRWALLLSTVFSLSLGTGESFGVGVEDSMLGEEPILVSKTIDKGERARALANAFKKDIEDGKFPERMHKALDTALRIAAYKLKRVGYEKEASELIGEWESVYSTEYMLYSRGESRHIGDYAPVSVWLKGKTDLLIFLLGQETAYNMRLSDLATFNETPKVILFCSGAVSEDEFGLHWIHDAEVYKRGLAPTVSFWVAQSACLGATFSTGFFICTPICGGVEWLVRTFVAVKTNEFMWRRACQ